MRVVLAEDSVLLREGVARLGARARDRDHLVPVRASDLHREVTEPAEAEQPLDIERSAAGHAGKRVLVVDDNRASADTLALLLRLSGFEVAVAYEGRQAVERAQAWHPDAW